MSENKDKNKVGCVQAQGTSINSNLVLCTTVRSVATQSVTTRSIATRSIATRSIATRSATIGSTEE